jgi:hypothetical protein
MTVIARGTDDRIYANAVNPGDAFGRGWAAVGGFVAAGNPVFTANGEPSSTQSFSVRGSDGGLYNTGMLDNYNTWRSYTALGGQLG